MLKTFIFILLSFSAFAQRSNLYTALEASYIILNVTDVVTTSYGLNHGAYERNGVMRQFTDKTYKIVLIKTVTIIPSLYFMGRIYEDNPKGATVGLIVLNCFYGFVVTNNINVIIKL